MLFSELLLLNPQSNICYHLLPQEVTYIQGQQGFWGSQNERCVFC